MRRLGGLLLLSLVSLAGPCFAQGVLTQAAGPVPNPTMLYDYRTSVQLQEDFLGGSTASGAIGRHGFGSGGGSTTSLASEANHPGIVRRDTSASSGTVTSLSLYPASSSALDPAWPTDELWIVRLNTNDANTTVRVGSLSAFGSSPPSHGMYFEKLDADTNWFCVTRAGGVQTRVDSGIAVGTDWVTLRRQRTAAGVTFMIGAVAVGGLFTTTIPTALLNPTVQIVNSAAASKTIDIDYFQINITGVSR